MAGRVVQNVNPLRWIKDNFFTVALLVLVAGYVAYQRLPLWLEAGRVEGRTAPEFALASAVSHPALEAVTDDGDPAVRLQELQTLYPGRRILLVFWATWCGVCRAEFDDLNAAHNAIPPEELAILGITAEEPGIVREFLETGEIEYPVLLDSSGRAHGAYGASVYPTMVWIGSDGTVEDVSHGATLGLRWRLRYWATGGAL